MRAAAALALTLLAAGCTPDRVPAPSLTRPTPPTPPPASAPSSTPSPAPSPAGPPARFAAVRGDQVVLVSAYDGHVTRVVHRVGPHQAATSTQLLPDGSVWFAVRDDAGGGTVLRVPASGGVAQEVSPGCRFAVSRDGRRLAVVGDARRCGPAVGIVDLASGQRRSWTAGSDDAFGDVAWTWDGTALLLVRSMPEAPGELVVFDPARDAGPRQARTLGPQPGRPPGTGWYTPAATAPGRLAAVQACCALDANSYDGGSYVVAARDADGRIVSSARLAGPVATLDADRTGRHLLLTDSRGTVWHRDPAGRLRRLGTGFRAASW